MPVPVAAAMLHGAYGSWDELLMIGMSALIGVGLAMALGSRKQKP